MMWVSLDRVPAWLWEVQKQVGTWLGEPYLGEMWFSQMIIHNNNYNCNDEKDDLVTT